MGKKPTTLALGIVLIGVIVGATITLSRPKAEVLKDQYTATQEMGFVGTGVAPKLEGSLERAPVHQEPVSLISEVDNLRWFEDSAQMEGFLTEFKVQRDLVEIEFNRWYEEEKIGSSQLLKVVSNPNWGAIQPQPDLALIENLPERQKAQVAYLFQNMILARSLLGERPFAPYAKSDGKVSRFLTKHSSLDLPLDHLLQHIYGKEKFDWPKELIVEVRDVRDQALMDASYYESNFEACEHAAIRAATTLNLPLDRFSLRTELPKYVTEANSSASSLEALSEDYYLTIEALMEYHVR